MALFGLAIVGMTTVVLLKGYVKFVEFMVHKCLGYYGIVTTTGGDRRHRRVVVVDQKDDSVEEKKKKVGWNEYGRKGGLLGVDDSSSNNNKKFVLDTNTMLFQPADVVVAAAKGRGKHQQAPSGSHRF